MSRSVLSIIGVLVLALVVTACGDTPPPSSSGEPSEAPESQAAESPGEESEAPAPAPTEGRLALVQDRGSLICGVNDGLPGFGFVDENGENAGFDVDFCRAIAAAVLGDAEAVEFRPVSADGRPTALQSGESDVLA